jgi:hypothetical protein
VLQEATEEATPATFLFVVAATGQAARETTNGVLYLVERAPTAFTAGKPPCEAAHCVLHLVERAAATLLLFAFLRLASAAFSPFAIGGTVVVLGVA